MICRLLACLPRLLPLLLLPGAPGCAASAPAPSTPAEGSAPAPSNPPAHPPDDRPVGSAAERGEPAAPADSGARPAAGRPAPEMVEAEATAAPARLPQVKITAPRKDVEIPPAKAAATEVKLGVRDWDLSATGSHLRAILDGRPAVRVTDLKARLTLGDLAAGGALPEGQHVLVVVPAYASGESVKPSGKQQPAAFVSFFVGKKRDVGSPWKDGNPLLVLSSPGRDQVQGSGVLVDFYVLNAEIAEGKYVVHAAVSGPSLQFGESLSSWKAYRVSHAQAGGYLAQISLFRYAPELGESKSTTTVRYTSQPVKTPFAEVRREFSAQGDPP